MATPWSSTTASRSTMRDRGKSSAIDGCGVNRFEEGGCYDCWQPRQFMASATIHGKQVSGSCVTHSLSGDALPHRRDRGVWS